MANEPQCHVDCYFRLNYQHNSAEKNARDTLSQRKRGLEVLAENLGDIKRSERCHFTMVEDSEPFKLHLTSMSYINEVFEHLLQP